MKVLSFYHIDGWWRHQPWRRWTPTMASLGHQPWRRWDTKHGVVGTATMASLGQQPSYFNRDATPMALVFGVIFATLV